MKTKYLALALLMMVASNLHADNFQISEKGPNYRVWSKTTLENGTNRIHRYVELASGLYFTNSAGQLTESSEEISLLPNGGAAATQGRHQVYFPADIYDGVIEVVTPDGRHLKSRPLGVSYDDGSNTVWIARLKHSEGELIGSNRVVYPDAFTDFKADLVCTYRRGDFESDLVCRESPPTPDHYGLNNASATLQLVTEFFNTADPSEVAGRADQKYHLQDQTLKFGALTMKEGRAFATVVTNSPPPRHISVYKSWVHAGNRSFLIEEVPVKNLANELSALPASTNSQGSKVTGKLRMASHQREWLPTHKMAVGSGRLQIASLDVAKKPGVVLDYDAVDMDESDFIFASGTTYYVSGSYNLGGTTTFEGGAIIKFLETYSGISCGVIVDTANVLSPVIFTSMNNDTVGEIIPGSTGIPTEDGNSFLQDYDTIELDYCQFSYSGTLVDVNTCTFNDCQFSECYWGIVGGLVTLNNSLACACNYCVDGSAICANDTFDNDAAAVDETSTFTNCIFSTVGSAVFDLYGFGSTPGGSNNGFYNTPTFGDNIVAFDGSYQSGPLGNFYLSPGSACIDAGNTTADQVGLFYFTTQANQVAETNSVVDLGYHYVAVDANGTLQNLLDSDGDGLSDAYEVLISHTNPHNPDTDGDGISDYDETLLHTDPLTPDPAIPASITIDMCPE